MTADRSYLRLPLTCLAMALLVACSGPTSNAPAGAGTQPPAQPAPSQSAPAQQDMSVSQLLGDKPGEPPAATPPSADGAPAATSTTATTEARNASASTDRGNGTASDAGAPPLDDAAYARVVSVKTIPGPRQICTDETVVDRRHSGDRHHVAGTVIGAIAGGVIGHQIGRGSGRAVATAGGAVAGGAIGRKIQSDSERREATTRVVRHCRPVANSESGVVLYDVIYAYQGQNFHVRLDHDPGDRLQLPVRGIE